MPTNQATRSHIITNHEAIRRWVEERGGVPARVKGTGGEGDAGVLRIDFSGERNNDQLEPISWDDFFGTFERNRLAFLYHDELFNNDNDYFKFVNEEFTKDDRDDEKEPKKDKDDDSDAKGDTKLNDPEIEDADDPDEQLGLE